MPERKIHRKLHTRGKIWKLLKNWISKEICRFIRSLDETQQARTFRAMIWELSAPRTVTKKALSEHEKQKSKRRKLDNTRHGTTVSLVFGQRLCQPAFFGGFQSAGSTVSRIAMEVLQFGIVEKIVRFNKSSIGWIKFKQRYEKHLFRSYGLWWFLSPV